MKNIPLKLHINYIDDIDDLNIGDLTFFDDIKVLKNLKFFKFNMEKHLNGKEYRQKFLINFKEKIVQFSLDLSFTKIKILKFYFGSFKFVEFNLKFCNVKDECCNFLARI